MRIKELYEARAVINGRPLLILKNPNAALLQFHVQGFRDGIGRGTLVHGDVMVWDAHYATHTDIEQFYGVPSADNGFHAMDNGEHVTITAPGHAEEVLLASPAFTKLVQDPRVIFVGENGEQLGLDKAA